MELSTAFISNVDDEVSWQSPAVVYSIVYLPTVDKLGFMIPVDKFILRPSGSETKVPPGVTIVGVIVDKSFTQYKVAGYLN